MEAMLLIQADTEKLLQVSRMQERVTPPEHALTERLWMIWLFMVMNMRDLQLDAAICPEPQKTPQAGDTLLLA